MSTLEARAATPPVLVDGMRIGVVEDVADPERLGRVRVRVFQVHDPDRSKVPTERLPWASRINLGGSGTHGARWVPPKGSQVAVLFFHGDPQHPFWLGTVEGLRDVPEEVAGRDPGTPANSEFGGNVFPGTNPARSADGATKVHILRTPGGHKVLLSDDADAPSLLFETGAGSIFAADDHPDRRKIQAQTPSGNQLLLDDAPGAFTRCELRSAGGHGVTLTDDAANDQQIRLRTTANCLLQLRDDGDAPLVQLRTPNTLHRLILRGSDSQFPGIPMAELRTPGGIRLVMQDGNDQTRIVSGDGTAALLVLGSPAGTGSAAQIGVTGGGTTSLVQCASGASAGILLSTTGRLLILSTGAVTLTGDGLVTLEGAAFEIRASASLIVRAPSIDFRSS